MKKTILYIHGFNSGPGIKSEILSKEFTNFKIISPQLKHKVDDDILLLKSIVENSDEIHIVGTSLGGFYAMILGIIFEDKEDLYVYLINPSLSPYDNLKLHLNKKFTNYKTGEDFIVTRDFIRDLQKYSGILSFFNKKNLTNFYFFLGMKDDVVNPSPLLNILKSFDSPYNLFTDDQDHRYLDITPVIKQIKENLII